MSRQLILFFEHHQLHAGLLSQQSHSHTQPDNSSANNRAVHFHNALPAIRSSGPDKPLTAPAARQLAKEAAEAAGCTNSEVIGWSVTFWEITGTRP